MIIDLSYWNGLIAWPRVRAAGVTKTIIRCAIGDRWVDDAYAVNWKGSAEAGIERRGTYHDLITGQSAAAQTLNILAHADFDFGSEPIALDVERTRDERLACDSGWPFPKAEYTAMLHDIVSALLAVHSVAIYTSAVEWAAMTTQPEWAKALPLWVAHYSTTIAAPNCPPGWDWSLWQYGQAPVDGIVEPVDVNRERVQPMKFTFPLVPRGSLVGIHAINPGDTLKLVIEARDAGAPYSAVKLLNDAAALAEVKRASPTTYTYLRYYNPADDSLQGLDNWTIAQRGEWCDRVLNKIYSQITAEQCKYVDWACAWNEEDPPGTLGYKDLGETFMILGATNERRKAAGQPYVKLAFGCLAQGTPELWEIDELIATGLFAWMQTRGYSWDAHEGVFSWQKIDTGMGDALPSTAAIRDLGPGHGDVPAFPGSGSGCFRFVWMFERRLRPLGQLVPLLIGEWYPGVPGQLDRYGWYDDRLSAYEYVTGFAGYNLGPTPDWPNLEPDYINPAFKQNRIGIRNRINGPRDDTMPISKAEKQALLDQANALTTTAGTQLSGAQHLASQIAAIVPDDAPPAWKIDDVAIAVANPFQLYTATHTPAGLPRPNYTSDQNVLAVSADGQWLKVFAVPEYWVRVSDVRHK